MRDAGETPARTPQAQPQRPAQPPGRVANDFRASVTELFNLINAERRRAGAPALRLDETMNNAAARRASELPRRYSHDRPDGRSYSTVFAEFGITPRTSAENVAWRSGQNNQSMADFNRAFMNSDGHRANMLNRNYTTVGLGIVRDGDRLYVAQLFAGDITISAQPQQPQSLSESLKELERSFRELRDLFR